jgi:phospholipid/cholesterol/gamma-HCH transport system substrate-binding protein
MAMFGGRSKPMKAPTRNQLALRGLVTLVLLAIVLELLNLRTNGTWGGPPTVSADLRNAGGALVKGSDVKLHGVIIGKVKAIEPGPDGGVRVDLSMDKGQLGHVPADVVARILPATVFGTTYVDLRPTGSAATATTTPAATSAVATAAPARSLRPGAVVPADTTQSTLELQDALDDIDSLVKALDPAELSTAIGAAAVALNGRGAALGTTAKALDAYLHQFNPKIAMLRADLDKLSQFLQVVQQIAPDLLDATDDVLVPLQTLVAHKADLKALLTGGKSLADTSAQFLAKNSVQLTRFINDAYGVVDAIYDNRQAGISGSIAANRAIGRIIQGAIEKGYLKVDAHLQLNAPGYYGTGDRPSYGGAQ